MPSVARTRHTSEQIRAEIEQTFGFFPPFFEPALASPQVLGNLWQQTRSAYINNPFSALFKEKLNALLSRFCAAPYCVIVHSSALRPLGMTAQQVLALLEAPPLDLESTLPLGALSVPAPEEAASPTPDSRIEAVILYCATAVFLERADAPACQAELRRLLGPDLYPHLVAYLAYIKTCHIWIEAHPEVSHEADRRTLNNLGPLLAEEPALAEFFRHYQERVADVQLGRVTQAAVTAERMRSDQAVRDSEEKLRLLVDGAKDYAMILLSAEGHITNWNAGAERIMGWDEAEVLGRPTDFIFTLEDRAAGVPTQEMEKASAEGKAMDLRWHLKKDGSRFFADGIMECLRAEDGTLRGLAKILRDATVQKRDQDAQSRAENERKRLQRQAELDQEELRVAHGRTVSILESITDAFFALDTDWNFTYLNDHAERLLRPRTVLLGRNVWEEFPAAVGTSFDRDYHRAVSEQVVVSFEEYYPPPLDTWFGVRAYPSPEGLSVYFHDISERKVQEKERERLAERERNIASQLQAALQPELPGAVPGLRVTKYYEAALADEAGVGGDFYDVFSIGKGCTAVVVGDLSGKGLRAAAQVSTVRNMLRAFLYSKPTVAEAITDLNRVLTENNLLAGFSTLFVGAYDSDTRALNFVNCGQEPALLRRAITGIVEPLLPTGPILGAIENVEFVENTLSLAPGDALAIFSDGLTEVGQNRLEMLGIDGVTALFTKPVAAEQVQDAADLTEHLALRLIEGVNAAGAGGAMRDDMCLLVAVVEDVPQTLSAT